MPNDAAEARYRLALMWEYVDISVTLILVRLHLKSITVEQKKELKKRTEFVRRRNKELNHDKELLLRHD